jgi:cellulose synthase/poly-beta-1,6-N-acetylglucosamine synthase-like glycosyltransferase
MLLQSILILVVIIFLLVLVFLVSKVANLPDRYQDHLDDYPKVSVLLAARNEANNIEPCLQALANLDYPADKIEVLIGNDRSEDDTEPLVQKFIQDRSNFKLINVTHDLGKAKSKDNVIAWLAHQALGDYFLITDADIQVPQQWARAMVQYFKPGIGLVSGITVVKGQKLFDKMQGLEWLYYMGLLRMMDEISAVTAVGNNMALRKEAYWQTGGYESLDSSVTEDYKIFQAITSKGWHHKHLLMPEVIATSEPAPNLTDLMQQRKRWLRGGMELPLRILALILLHNIYFPAVIVLLILNPMIGIGVLILKAFVQDYFLYKQLKFTNLNVDYQDYLVYEIYNHLISLITPLYFIWPTQLKWKKRKI